MNATSAIAPLRCPHQRNDLAEPRRRADGRRLHHKAAGPVERPAGDGIADRLVRRHRLTREHRLVDVGLSLDDLAIDGDSITRTYAQKVTFNDSVERHILVAAIADATRSFGRKVEQGTDRLARRFTRAQLEHLPDEHQRDDHSGCLEIHRRPGVAHGHREQLRRDHRDDREQIGRADTQPDQRPHVRRAVAERRNKTPEERPRRPGDHRCCEHQLRPERGRLTDPRAERQPHHAAHRKQQDGYAQHSADDQPPREVGKFGVGRIVQRRNRRFERHAADRTVTGTILNNLRMHRAGVRRTGDRNLRRLRRGRIMMVGCVVRVHHRFSHRQFERLGVEVLVRVTHKARAAAFAAEVVRLTVMLGRNRRPGIDHHAADGVTNLLRRASVAAVIVVLMVHSNSPTGVPS